jgi:5-methylcytosine-specific restriction endonuclease McrA
MAWYDDSLDDIYYRTDGKCHICGKKLSRVNYASPGQKGAWEVEHSVPKSKGGTDCLNNLYPACISCNRSKGTYSSRTARAQYGRRKAPLSKEKKLERRRESAFRWGAGLGFAGLILGGWSFAAGGAILGAAIGYHQDPEKE